MNTIKEKLKDKKIIVAIVIILGLLISIGSCSMMNANSEPKKENQNEVAEKDNGKQSNDDVTSETDKNSNDDKDENEKKDNEVKEDTKKDTQSGANNVTSNNNNTTENKKNTTSSGSSSNSSNSSNTSNSSSNSSSSSKPNKPSNSGNTSNSSSNSSSSSKPNKPSNSGSGSNNSSNPSNSGSTAPSKPEHKHTWVEQFKTVHHEEVFHMEPVYECQMRVLCNVCDADITNSTTSEVRDHIKSHDLKGETGPGGISGYRESMVQVMVGEEKVVDTPAWDEKVLIGYKCSCGATK